MTRNREDALAYKRALDAMNGPESALLISELPGSHPCAQHSRVKVERQRRSAVERFDDPDDPLAILIACGRFGERASLQQVTYLDAGPRGHTLLRMLSQANRALPGKTHATVIDYAGVLSRGGTAPLLSNKGSDAKAPGEAKDEPEASLHVS